MAAARATPAGLRMPELFRHARSLLDSAHTLHLEGLGVRSPLSEVLVVTGVVIALQHVLKTSVAGKLGAHPAGKGKRQSYPAEAPAHPLGQPSHPSPSPLPGACRPCTRLQGFGACSFRLGTPFWPVFAWLTVSVLWFPMLCDFIRAM